MIRQIVRHDRSMEQIVFPVPNICEFLTEESKGRVFHTTERDDQGSKVNDFFQQFDNLYNEMRWQKKIRSERPAAPGCRRHAGRAFTRSSVLSAQETKLSSGSPATSLCGGASPSTWPAWLMSPWLFFTPSAMMEMRVRCSYFEFMI